jgi:uncharacterized membrane protein YdjX (TVP38/TMEM64 family)
VALIAAAVVAFGPWWGSLYSWIGTLVSACIGFGLGRLAGGSLLREYGGEGLNRFTGLIGRNGFIASLVVRLAPAAPFVAVNMAGGVTRMRFAQFFAGTAIGIVPKIVLTAAAGASAAHARHTALWINLSILVAVVGVWIGVGLVARRWIKRQEAVVQDNGDA